MMCISEYSLPAKMASLSPEVNLEIDDLATRQILTEIGELRDELGAGSYGTVFSTSKGYAYKRIENDRGLPSRSFIQEVGMMRKVNHQNVMSVLHVLVRDDHSAIVMPLAQSDLNRYLKSRRIDEMALMKSLALGLHAIHNSNIIHGDLKPGNVLIVDSVPKISDFGIARDRVCVTRNMKDVLYSLYWRPPESFSGDTYELSMKSDIWALGVMFVEIATAAVSDKANPFSPATNNDELLTLHENTSDILRNIFRAYGIDPTLQALITRMLSLNPRSRPSISDVLNHPYFESSKRYTDEDCISMLRRFSLPSIPSHPSNILALVERVSPLIITDTPPQTADAIFMSLTLAHQINLNVLSSRIMLACIYIAQCYSNASLGLIPEERAYLMNAVKYVLRVVNYNYWHSTPSEFIRQTSTLSSRIPSATYQSGLRLMIEGPTLRTAEEVARLSLSLPTTSSVEIGSATLPMRSPVISALPLGGLPITSQNWRPLRRA